MSSKKIIRLKTPTKIKQSGRTPESTFANTHFIELDTITQVHNNEYYQVLHQNLISEINKLYRDIQTIKKEVEQQQAKNINLHQEKNRLKNHIVLLQRQCISYKEMYQLQRHNHLRLRTFYQQRERQWQYIVFEHKRMLEQFDRKHQTSLSKIEQVHQILQETREEDLEQINRQEPQRQQYKRVKRLSAQKNKKPLLQKKPMHPQQAYFVAEINRLYAQEQKFTKRSQLNLLQQSQLKGLALRNPEIDDLFDRIMRKTYYYFRQKCFTINKMKECQDMIKLKHAKTSTKERLLKTVKKLEFQAQTQSQLATFCQHIEELVLKQQKMLRGDLVFNFIVDRLKQCEKLALTSNSQIEKMELNSLIEGRQLNQNKQQQQMLDIERISRQNLQLLLNSAIKKPKFSQVSQNIRYSISSLQNLSDLIHGETVGANNQTGTNI